jgi:hypothetical protein
LDPTPSDWQIQRDGKKKKKKKEARKDTIGNSTCFVRNGSNRRTIRTKVEGKTKLVGDYPRKKKERKKKIEKNLRKKGTGNKYLISLLKWKGK